MAGKIKERFPESKIYFLGRTYTQAIIEKSDHIDHFINFDEIDNVKDLPDVDVFIHVYPDIKLAKLAKKAGIKTRIGTSHRIFHWVTCNKLVHFTRKNSALHESQLNLKLLKPLGIEDDIKLIQIPDYYGWKLSGKEDSGLLTRDKFNLILHPKSKGSAVEWSLENYYKLAESLPAENFRIYITGTEEEGLLISQDAPELFKLPNTVDVTGKFSLSALINFIEHADGLLACSTGPLHIASVSGIYALGLYPSSRPMHPGRWGPVGVKSMYLTDESSGSKKRALQIPVMEVKDVIENWITENKKPA